MDLLQRATGKLRWQPIVPAMVEITNFDYIQLPYSAKIGAKPLLDALKVKTTGRSNGRLLYYFGAIFDDSPKYLTRFVFQQKVVTRPEKARTKIIVRSGE